MKSNKFFVVLAPCGCWWTSIIVDPFCASDIAAATKDAIRRGHEFKTVTHEEWRAIPSGCEKCKATVEAAVERNRQELAEKEYRQGLFRGEA